MTENKWIRLPTKGRCPETGLTRGYYYDLIKKGKIKSSSIKKPGNLTGIRLVWLPSVMSYIDSCVVDKTPTPQQQHKQHALNAQSGEIK